MMWELILLVSKFPELYTSSPAVNIIKKNFLGATSELIFFF